MSSGSLSSPDAPAPPPTSASRHGRLGPLSVMALGVVFGDIGTSPLYTLHECLSMRHGVAPTPANILGVLSLIFWSLTMVVSIKYLTVIMRADNHGEGGIFALLALLPERKSSDGTKTTRAPIGSIASIGWAPLLVIAGAALLYGDGMITPSISVLSAIEGLEIAAPELRPVVLPLTCAVLLGLFLLQRRGTGSVGRLFGPVMTLWFISIGALGARQLVRNPAVLAALDPRHAFHFFLAQRSRGFVVLGSVVLAVTGGEALYADMGHFGPRPIRVAWFGLAMPALVINYFGQGALMLVDQTANLSPFFALVPRGFFTYALVGLSTVATVIASQALISGAFSMTHQAVQLGYLPRLTIMHTSVETEGQIYVPEVNWLLASACVVLVLTFRRSEHLAAAYGIAVTGTMAITSIIYFQVTRQAWHWSLAKALPFLLLFLSFDLPFFAANLLKVRDGGFVPLLVGMVLFLVMVTWKRGRALYRNALASSTLPFDSLIAAGTERAPARIPGAGIFLASSAEGFPPVVSNLIKRVHMLPETVVLLTVEVRHVPRLPGSVPRVEAVGQGIFRVIVERGFMDAADVPGALADALVRFTLPIQLDSVTYYLGRDTFLATSAGRMGRWSENFFALLVRSARSPVAYFHIPPHQVVEIGSQIEL